MVDYIKDKVSVVIPVYNEERFLRLALDSVVNQVDCVLIGDNASTDSTQAICLEFVDKYPHIKYFRHEDNIGMAANYNFLYSKVETEFVFHAGGHDLIPCNYTASLKKKLTENPSAIAAFGNLTAIDLNGQEIHTRNYSKISNNHSFFGGLFKKEYISAEQGRDLCLFDWHFVKTLGLNNKSISDLLSQDCPLPRTAAYILMRVLNGTLYGLYRSEKSLDKFTTWKPIVGPDVIIIFDLLLRGKFIHEPGTAYLERDVHGRKTSRVQQLRDRSEYMKRVAAGNDTSYNPTQMYQHLYKNAAMLRKSEVKANYFCFWLACRLLQNKCFSLLSRLIGVCDRCVGAIVHRQPCRGSHEPQCG